MTWNIDIENIAGIYDGQARVEPGLNAVKGSNWQGKSSFIEAIKTALGTATTLTEGKEHGQVMVHTPETEAHVELHRSNGAVRVEGRPYLADEYDVTRAALFACLGEQNEVRQTVRDGDNLKDVLLRPLDFQNIERQIADRKREREQIDTELAQATEANKRLPSAQERVTQLKTEVDELQQQHEELSETTPDAADTESVQGELSQARTDRDQAENQLERLTQTIERLEDRLENRRDELATISIDEEKQAAVESELETAHEELDTANQRLDVLQSVYSTTELVLEEDQFDLITDVNRELTGDSIVCWTCGTEVDRSVLDEQLETLGTKITAERSQLKTHRDQIEELEAKREELTQAQRRKQDLETEIEELEDTLADRKQNREETQTRFNRLAEEVESLSERVDSEVDQLTDIESEIKYQEAELEDARDELENLESRASQIEKLEDAQEELKSEIAELRNRKQQITYQAREEFTDAIQEMTERFETGFESAHLTGDFDLIVARDGREASLDALSEGELELIGFIAALAGYESFDVGDVVPIMLIDGVGSLADENLHRLVEYLRERTDYLVFTTYPEHTAFDGQTIDPTEWSVASRTPTNAEQ